MLQAVGRRLGHCVSSPQNQGGEPTQRGEHQAEFQSPWCPAGLIELGALMTAEQKGRRGRYSRATPMSREPTLE
eukprot:3959895-Prymnesium_polylepis.2